MRVVDLRGTALTLASVSQEIPRAALDIASASKQIAPLLEAIETRGLEAIHEVSLKYDGFVPEPIWAESAEFDAALDALDPQLLAAIQQAIESVRQVSTGNLTDSVVSKPIAGGQVTTRQIAVDSVGLYVPGGKAVYPSSVVMNVVPAQVAGVKRLVIATPGQREFGGRPHPTVLATAKLLGVENVLVVGGPAAIGALAHGIAEVLEPVDMITGPGNIFVAAAKRLVRGKVGIDSEAGTTEILIVADETANARFVALDLLSQAEHDEAAASVLVTDSVELIAAVQSEIDNLLPTMQHSERIAIALSGIQSALVLVDDLSAAAEFANFYAAEHLEIQTADAQAVANRIRHAGAIFVGDYSPVSLGDYMAGSNHVLPTGGTARFNSGLGVHTFLRSQQVVEYSAAGLEALSAKIDLFARAEGLDAHGRAVTERFN
jgi:histidinol dehydrogenase